MLYIANSPNRFSFFHSFILFLLLFFCSLFQIKYIRLSESMEVVQNPWIVDNRFSFAILFDGRVVGPYQQKKTFICTFWWCFSSTLSYEHMNPFLRQPLPNSHTSCHKLWSVHAWSFSRSLVRLHTGRNIRRFISISILNFVYMVEHCRCYENTNFLNFLGNRYLNISYLNKRLRVCGNYFLALCSWSSILFMANTC